MSYKILYTKTALSDIKKLDSVVKKRFKKKLEVYSQNPLDYAKRLVDSSTGPSRWRIGNYRVIFDIDGKNIVVLRIRHRRESYK